MQEDHELIQYYMQRTDNRLARMEHKIEQLISFRMMLYGMAAAISAIVSVLIAVYFGRT